MISAHKFSAHFFNHGKTAIHIENGYVDENNIFNGIVRKTGEYDYDGVQIVERLNEYHNTLEKRLSYVGYTMGETKLPCYLALIIEG